MGFGGGAMIGSPLAVMLMDYFKTPSTTGVAETFLVMAAVYLVFMLAGAFGYRVPPSGWKPQGWTAPASQTNNAMITQKHVHASKVWGIPQFWLVWMVLMCNVSAGIGILGMASPLLQEVFAGRLIGVSATFNQLSPDQLKTVAALAAGFAGLLSLFNILGRFFWASCSDLIGRKNTYTIFLVLGLILYSLIPGLGQAGSLAMFVLAFCVILSMYGGGFATIPAYLADLFGTQMVGAIHGRLLTAWATAGIVGPIAVNYLRDYQLAHGAAKADAYNVTMYVLAGMLVIGLICNLLIKPVAAHHFMSEEELNTERRLAHERAQRAEQALGRASSGQENTPFVLVLLAWAAVGIPMLWGLTVTLEKAMKFLK